MPIDPNYPAGDESRLPKGQLPGKRPDAGDKVDANEGEGNRTAARAYNKATQEYVASGKVPKAAEDAARAVAGPEEAELRRAEAVGKSHSHGEDPALRGPAKPSR